MQKSSFIFILLLIKSTPFLAQTSFNSGGANSDGLTARISYSIGQVFFTTNTATGVEYREGVQQSLLKYSQPATAMYMHEAVASTGNDYTGSNNKMSMTIGQPFYLTKMAGSEKLREGVQQPVNFSMLYVHVFIQGFYQPGLGTMVEIIGPGLTDTITVALHSSVAPYEELYSAETILNIYGRAKLRIPSVYRGDNCYFAIRHRNSLQTWSKSPFTVTAGNLFDLTY